MMGIGRSCRLFVWVITLSGGIAAAQSPTYSVEVAAIDGVPVVPPMSNLEVEPGNVLTVEVYLRNWSVGGVPLKAYQFSFNPAGYTSGFSGNLYPKDFATTTQVPSACSNTDTVGPQNTANAFIDTTRVDFVHFGLNPLQSVGTRRCGYRYGSAVQSAGPTSVPNSKKYCGTLILKVSDDASGTFHLALDPDPSTKSFLRSGFANDQPTPIVPLVFEQLTVTVVPEIDLDIIAAFPPNNAIDARRPSNLDGSNPTGIMSIDVTFNKPAANLSPGDFIVSVEPAGPAPSVMNVTPNGNKVTVQFNTFIPVGKWTTLTHNDFTPTSTRVGYLPGDSDGNMESGPLDVLWLIQGLNNGNSLPLYQSDINRSVSSNPLDIEALIEVLNGAQELVPWNGQTLPSR